MKTTELSIKPINWLRLQRGLLFLLVFGASLIDWNFAQAQDGDELNNNTAEGRGALHTYIATANGSFGDTALGSGTLYSNTSGSSNTATGYAALTSNTSGSFNTATGSGALLVNSAGSNNTATGAEALVNNS